MKRDYLKSGGWAVALILACLLLTSDTKKDNASMAQTSGSRPPATDGARWTIQVHPARPELTFLVNEADGTCFQFHTLGMKNKEDGKTLEVGAWQATVFYDFAEELPGENGMIYGVPDGVRSARVEKQRRATTLPSRHP